MAGQTDFLLSELKIPSMTEKMPRRRIRAHYEQLSEFERGRIIGLKEAGWANWRIARYMRRSGETIKRYWQEKGWGRQISVS
ncbi:hypothetical protein TNCV_2979471 [Trichonephila clavipes]|nr:hypothetical protein TNCV_2979471 [Trichonephila clavipes]